jgi:hypothetical protein
VRRSDISSERHGNRPDKNGCKTVQEADLNPCGHDIEDRNQRVQQQASGYKRLSTPAVRKPARQRVEQGPRQIETGDNDANLQTACAKLDGIDGHQGPYNTQAGHYHTNCCR